MARRIQTFRDLIDAIKDKASQSKAVLSKPTAVSLHLALLRATTHDAYAPPSDKHLDALLSFGNGSRANCSAVIQALVDRLQHTSDSSVAIKCLIAVHHITNHGSSILQDRLSVYPTTGGRNYLNLSNFRDPSTPNSWELSAWVRWFAHYVEHLLCTSRILGFFLCSSSTAQQKDENHEALSSIANSELLRELDSLVGLVEEMCRRPDAPFIEYGNKMVIEVMCMVGEDYLSAVNEISVRVSEFEQRLGQLGFGESVDLLCGLKRMEDCKEKTAAMVTRKKAMMETFWVSITEMKERVWSRGLSSCDTDKDRGRKLKRDKGVSESARFQERVLKSDDSIRFPSARFGAAVSSRFRFQGLDAENRF